MVICFNTTLCPPYINPLGYQTSTQARATNHLSQREWVLAIHLGRNALAGAKFLSSI